MRSGAAAIIMAGWFTTLQVIAILVALAAIFSSAPLTSRLPAHVHSYLPSSIRSLLHLSSHHPPLACVPPIPGQRISAPLALLPPPSTAVLVTGAAGFVGSHVTAYLSSELQLRVVAVDDLSGGFLSNVPSSPLVTFVQGDVSDPAFVHRLFLEHGPFHTVYHLAAYAAEGMSHFIRRFNYRNNLLASVTLLNEAVLGRAQSFVFTSSIAVYGPIDPPMRETDVPHPHDPYGIAKYAFELDLQSAQRLFNLSFVILRPHNVYGPHQNVIDRYRNVIGIFISRIMRNLSLPIFGDGLQTRAFSYIDDVAPVIAASPFVPAALNTVLNVGGDRPYSLRTLARVVSEAMGVEERVEWLQERSEVVHAVSDHARVRCVMGIGEPVGLEEGIQRVVEWVKEKGGKDGFVPVEFDEVEVMQNMPPSWITEAMRVNERRRMAKDHSPQSTARAHTET